jgi:two-component sensor histidine kinase
MICIIILFELNLLLKRTLLKMKKSFLILIFFPLGLFAQSKQIIDSLKSEIPKVKNPESLVNIYHQIVEGYLNNQADSTQKYTDLALRISEKTKNPLLIAKSYLQRGNYLQDRTRFDEALTFYQKAVDIFEKENNKSGAGRTYTSMCRLYKRMSSAQNVRAFMEKALSYSFKAIEYLKAVNDNAGLMAAYNNQGITYRDLNELEKAHEDYLLGLDIAKKNNIENTYTGILNANLGQYYMDRNQPNKAIFQLEKALVIHQKLNNQSAIEHAYRNLSYAFRQKKEYQKAVELAQKSVDISKTLNDPHRAFNSYEALYLSQKDAGLFKEALESLEINKDLEDSTIRAEKTKGVAEIETKYQTEKKEILIQKLDEKNQLQRMQIIGFVIGLALLLGLLVALYNQNQTVKASQKQISEQSDQLKLMMKELHHRVKNNLAIVSSLLKIQSSKIEDEKAVQAVRQGQQRVEAMSLIHQRLYQTDKVTNINIKEYINDLADSLMSAYGYTPDQFDLGINIEKEQLDVDLAIPLGLIINELLTNSFKYAYQKVERPALLISLKTNNGLTLEVQDNGPGIDLERWQKAKDSFGKKLIAGLTKQIGGTFTMENKEGSYFKLQIPQEKLKMAA